MIETLKLIVYYARSVLLVMPKKLLSGNPFTTLLFISIFALRSGSQYACIVFVSIYLSVCPSIHP